MKSLILLISVVGLVAAKPLADTYAYAPVYSYYTNPLAVASNQFHAQDEIGQYNYGYSNPDSSKTEVKTADGVVQGSYSYVDANGVLQTTNYISDALGFRVAATNLPVAPVAEAVAGDAVPAVEVKAAEAPVAAVNTIVAANTVVAPQQVVVPYVQYANLPYATNFPHYVAQPAVQQVVGAPVLTTYTQLVEPTVQQSEPLVEANSEDMTVALAQAYTAEQPTVEAAAPVQEIVSVPILTQYHSQDELGQYQFSYSDQSASRSESKTADGVITGSYNYVDGNGQIQEVTYVADDQGFRANGALPVPVQETPEVAAAREEHLRLVAENIASQPQEEQVTSVIETVEPTVEQQAYVAVQPAVEQQAYVAVQPAVEQQAYPYQPYLVSQPLTYQVQPYAVQQQAYVEAQPTVQQQAYVAVQPAIQQQAYLTAQATVPELQYIAAQPAVGQQYAAVQPQTYATSQPIVAQPYLVGQPIAVSQTAAAASTQFHAQDELGQYEYGYANEHSFKTEHKTADGVVRGSYSYVDANGIVQRVDYISDALGFRVAATNLPVHQQPTQEVEIAKAEEPAPAVTPAVEEPVVSVTAEPIIVPAEYEIGIRSGLEALDAVPAIESVPAEVTVVAAKEETLPVVQQVVQQVAVPYAQQFVQAAPQVDVQYAGQYLLPGYTANYAAAYQPYAANYGYYYNPSYVATSGALTHSQYHAQDEIGQYNYGYATADSSKTEVKSADGIVQGTYSYVDANGIVQTTNYISDQWGFRVAATNLPVAPVAVEAPAAPAA